MEPAGLFRSDDRGATWEHVAGLTEHPSRPEWLPGNGGLILHTIVPHPTDHDRLWVGISSVGVFETQDGGATWATRNTGVRADFYPGRRPSSASASTSSRSPPVSPSICTSRTTAACTARSTAARTWQEITGSLPSDFGFAMAAHPRDPTMAWTIPLNPPDKGRTMPEGAAAV